MIYEGAVQDLIDELGRLPGVGPKSAQRIAFHLLAAESADVGRLVAALQRVQAEVRALAGRFPLYADLLEGIEQDAAHHASASE